MLSPEQSTKKASSSLSALTREPANTDHMSAQKGDESIGHERTVHEPGAMHAQVMKPGSADHENTNWSCAYRSLPWLSMFHRPALPEAPRRVIRVRGRHRGFIRALSGIHTPGGCAWWMWNDQTGGTNRFLMRRADWSSMSPACCQTEAPRRVIRVRGRHRGPIRALSGTHTPGGCVWWMWND